MILKDKSPAEVHLMAARSAETLRSRLRITAREHGDRIRQLTELMRKVSANDFDDAETLAGIKGITVSPELEKLILNPTHGL